jgi:uncharacterized protein YeaO (DUF488 family)
MVGGSKKETLALKRAYESPSPGDGFRVLVERLWPRGLKKETVALDLWLKEIAPSPELRQWFGHDPAKWEEFCRRYWAELAAQPDAVKLLKEKLKQGKVTLVYGSKDEKHNAAVALKKFLEDGAWWYNCRLLTPTLSSRKRVERGSDFAVPGANRRIIFPLLINNMPRLRVDTWVRPYMR